MYDRIEVQVQAMDVDQLGAPIPRDVKTREFDNIEDAIEYAKSDNVDKGQTALILVYENGVAKQYEIE
jgi:hypothetical protein